jgi:hypothetical protein
MRRFGPRDEQEAAVYAEEYFRVDIQQKIYSLMLSQKVSDQELASRLRVPEECVKGFFRDDAKIDFRTLARIFYVLGHKCDLKVTANTVPRRD